MAETRLKPPLMPAEFTPWTGDVTRIHVGWQASAAIIEGADFSGVKAASIALDQVRLDRVLLAGSKLQNARLWDVELVKCECAGALLVGTTAHCLTATQCRMSGINFSEAELEHVRFEACKLDLTNFRAARLEWVEFVDCELKGADFVGAKLSNVRFEGCNVAEVDFERCTMAKVDLRTSEIEEIKSAEGLTGATIDSIQLLSLAPKLASRLGIKVRDER